MLRRRTRPGSRPSTNASEPEASSPFAEEAIMAERISLSSSSSSNKSCTNGPLQPPSNPESGPLQVAAAFTTACSPSMPTAAATTYPTIITTSQTSKKRHHHLITNTSTPSTFSFLMLSILLLVLHIPTASSLRILLTNDDGLEQPGLRLLRDALLDSGHEVHTFVSAADKTGLSASVGLRIPYQPLTSEVNVTLVEAPPASSVIAGLSLMSQQQQQQQPPDLVVVGISDGFATGSQMLHSSAVGAAVIALTRQVPTMTIAGIPTLDGVAEEEYFGSIASFFVQFLQVYEENEFDLPPGFGLKLGYPPLAAADIQGVALAAHGLDAPLSFGYAPSQLSTEFWQIVPIENSNVVDPQSEEGLIQQGYISVLPISSRLYLPATDFHVKFILQLKRLLRVVEALGRQDQVKANVLARLRRNSNSEGEGAP